MEEYNFENEVARIKLETGHVIDGINSDANKLNKKFLLKAMIDTCLMELIQIEDVA